MKKVYMLGMVLVTAACFAYAASMSVPWFVDNAAPGTGLPPTVGNVSLIYLHNNLESDVTCEIAYYDQDGNFLGPEAPLQTTFSIPALATIAFRPVQDDPESDGGQESEAAAAVPNRPTANPNTGFTSTKTNGSCVIRWTTGGANDVQGLLVKTQHHGSSGAYLEYGTLLPPGVG